MKTALKSVGLFLAWLLAVVGGFLRETGSGASNLLSWPYRHWVDASAQSLRFRDDCGVTVEDDDRIIHVSVRGTFRDYKQIRTEVRRCASVLEQTLESQGLTQIVEPKQELSPDTVPHPAMG